MWIDVFDHWLMNVIRHVCRTSGVGCLEALPPDEAVRPCLPPAFACMEARHISGSLRCGCQAVVRVRRGVCPCNAVLGDRQVHWTVWAVPATDLEVDPIEVFSTEFLQAQVLPGRRLVLLGDPVCMVNRFALSNYDGGLGWRRPVDAW